MAVLIGNATAATCGIRLIQPHAVLPVDSNMKLLNVRHLSVDAKNFHLTWIGMKALMKPYH